MAARNDPVTIFQQAFNVARRVQTFAGGLRSFRRENPEIEAREARAIFTTAWERAGRVKYLEDSNQGWYINKRNMNCPERGKWFRYTFRVVFTDNDGNQFDQHFHVSTRIRDRIGQTNRDALKELEIQLMSEYYGLTKGESMENHVINIHMVNVVCLTGGSTR